MQNLHYKNKTRGIKELQKAKWLWRCVFCLLGHQVCDRLERWTLNHWSLHSSFQLVYTYLSKQNKPQIRKEIFSKICQKPFLRKMIWYILNYFRTNRANETLLQPRELDGSPAAPLESSTKIQPGFSFLLQLLKPARFDLEIRPPCVTSISVSTRRI